LGVGSPPAKPSSGVARRSLTWARLLKTS